MTLSRVKDGIPLDVIRELNLEDNDEIFWRQVEENGQRYYIVSKNDCNHVPVENIERKSISKTDIITNKDSKESFRDYQFLKY